MDKTISQNHNIQAKQKKLILFIIIIFGLSFLILVAFLNIATDDRKLPNKLSSSSEGAIRGKIISKDGFNIAASKKLYKATIDTRCLNPDKKELFIKLFSIYSDIDENIVREKINSHTPKGTLTLTYKIDSRTAKNLQELSYKLKKLDVFDAIYVNEQRIIHGLKIIESGEQRVFPYINTLTPAIGYLSKFENNNSFTKTKGVKGLERFYDDYLNNINDGVLRGERDVLSHIVFNKKSTIKTRRDGYSLMLNIPLKLQKNVEFILDRNHQFLLADEIIATVMNSSTGEILTLGSSTRFFPNKIGTEDYKNLNVNAIEYQFEPGSVLKPISISLALDLKKVKLTDMFSAYNYGSPNAKGEYPKGAYPFGRFKIKDDHEFKKNILSIQDIIMYSSNIGTLQIAQKMNAQEFSDGLKRFGITQKTGIDLPYEKVGWLPSVANMAIGEKYGHDNIYKATVSYGQGMTATFMQLVKAYSVFNNDGIAVTPKIVNKLLKEGGEEINITTPANNKRVISKETANIMKQFLVNTVEDGTGSNTKIDGLQVGGKTGTAQVAGLGGYKKEYISSFIGFVNDASNNKYIIGVTVRNPRGTQWYHYYASQSAVPVFKEIVDTLVRLNYLKPTIINKEGIK